MLFRSIAIGAIKYLTEKGIKVPEDVSVVGFDDAAYCDYTSPSLTSVNSETEQLCEISFEMLEKKIKENVSVYQSVLVRTKLNVRDSTAKAKKFRN